MDYIPYIRGLVGRHKIFIAYASLVLRDAQGRVLLQRRADFNVWGLPGGALELGEDILSCARRELREETGLQAGALRLVGVYCDPAYDTVYPNGDQVQQYTVCFEGKAAGGQLQGDGGYPKSDSGYQKSDSIETLDLRFFPPAELPLAELPVFYVDMLRDALSGGPPAYAPPYTRPDPVDQIQNIRQIIGHAPIIGVGATAVIVDGAGRILVTRRTDNGQWCLPGGFSNLGENAAYTIIREVYEETGLHVQPERLMGVFSPTLVWEYPNGDRTQGLVSIFACRQVSGQPRADQVETSQLAWASPAEFVALDMHAIFTPLHRAVVECLDRGAFVL